MAINWKEIGQEILNIIDEEEGPLEIKLEEMLGEDVEVIEEVDKLYKEIGERIKRAFGS